MTVDQFITALTEIQDAGHGAVEVVYTDSDFAYGVMDIEPTPQWIVLDHEPLSGKLFEDRAHAIKSLDDNGENEVHLLKVIVLC